jgi:hypothetical protein
MQHHIEWAKLFLKPLVSLLKVPGKMCRARESRQRVAVILISRADEINKQEQ